MSTTARKSSAKKSTPVIPVQCKPCKGTGEVSRTVYVGRKRRPAGEQTGMCLSCFGTGEHAPR
jgi:DnaJ-class molecular chaperone